LPAFITSDFEAAFAKAGGSRRLPSPSPPRFYFLILPSSFLLPLMPIVGTVESLWRYPVKSMRGEEVNKIFAGYAGVYGDRLFAFESSVAPKGFPFFTGRELRQMIRYRPRFRHPDKAVAPINLNEAAELSPNINPVSANVDDLMVDVETPDGKTFAIDDPSLIDHLRSSIAGKQKLTLLRSDKAITDCRPLSIFAVQTARKLGEETGVAVDKRRFRANVYVDLGSSEGFAEDEFVGRSLRIGSKATVAVLQRDGRCMMITLDPDTAEKTPSILKAVAQSHESMAGVYGAVLAEGLIRKGDPVELLD
jgi:uncharacterized protein YcbX